MAEKRVAIIGATSAIAVAVARRYAEMQAAILLIGRDAARLEVAASDLRARGSGEVTVLAGDYVDAEAQGRVVEAIRLHAADRVLIAFGMLGEQERDEHDARKAAEVLQVNFTAVATLLLRIAALFETSGKGKIGVIASVAGDRGRRKNYIYGSAKAGLAVFCEGLRYRLLPRCVTLTCIKPGFVDTPMTAGMKKGLLFASPDRIARDIVNGIEAGRGVVYSPWWWIGIMTVLRLLPEAIFRRLPV